MVKMAKIFKIFLAFVVLIFLFSYFLCFSGYYEYNLQKKKELTEEEIKRFEEDVKSGKEIDLNSYLESVSIDYSNNLTRRTSYVNLRLNDYLKKILTGGFDMLGKFIK